MMDNASRQYHDILHDIIPKMTKAGKKGANTMKYRIIKTLLIGTVAAVLTACGAETDNSPQEVTATTEKNGEKSEQGQQAEDQEDTKDAFTQFEDALKEKGIDYEKNVTAAEMIGAEQGMKFKIGDGAVELYRFDTGSDAYTKAEETQSIYLEGFGAFPATVKDGLAMTISDLEEAEYTEIFDNIKAY